MMHSLLADATTSAPFGTFLQQVLIGLTNGSLIALIALGYTMVYGIIGLINFAHGDLFMLGSFFALTVISLILGIAGGESSSAAFIFLAIFVSLVLVPLFCASLNVTVDYIIYKPLRNAPKLAPLVSAIGVSFIFMNAGLLWRGASPVHFPNILPGGNYNLFELINYESIRFTVKDLTVILITVPVMVGLTLFVKYTKLGTAMRATEQSQLAARLMGINVDRVIAVTFGIGGALAGVASVIYGLTINTVSFQMGFQNGIYAFTAAVLGGIGSLPGAMLGGLIIGLVRSLGSEYIGENWTNALIFSILIAILVFRPSGLLGKTGREKV